MPRLDWVSWSFWILSIAAELSVAAILYARKLHREWPAVMTYVSAKAFCDLFLALTALEVWGYDRTPMVYFYGYWTSSAVYVLLECWLLVEIGLHVAPVLRRWILPLVPAAALLYLGAAAWIVGFGALSPSLDISHLIVNMDRVVALAWLGLFICLTCGSDSLGIRWNRHELGVALGLSIQLINDVGLSCLMGLFPSHLYLFSNIYNALWLLAMGIWIQVFLSDAPATEGHLSLEELSSLTDLLMGLLGSRRRYNE